MHTTTVEASLLPSSKTPAVDPTGAMRTSIVLVLEQVIYRRYWGTSASWRSFASAKMSLSVRKSQPTQV